MQAELFVIAALDPQAIHAQARDACAALHAVLGDLADIQHIGSTAVAGCLTKGDVDICVRVFQADFAKCEAVLSQSLVRNEGSDRTESFASFYLGEVGVQLVVIGSENDDFIRFRDALVTSPDMVQRYNNLKRAWNGKPMTEYREAKGKFVTMALKKIRPPRSPWRR